MKMSGVRRRDNDLDQLIVIPEHNLSLLIKRVCFFHAANFIQWFKDKRAFPVSFICITRMTSF